MLQNILNYVQRIHHPSTFQTQGSREQLGKVIIRVETILYSKARTQVEYENADDLAERTRDAINVIVGNEGEEVPDLNAPPKMMPCIEAEQCHASSRECHISSPPAWSMLTRLQTAGMDQESREMAEAYQAWMLALITEAKKRADEVADAEKKKAEDAEKARLLAIEQQRQQDEAAAKAADEERNQRCKKIFNGERALLTMAADWRAEAENGKMEESESKIALLLSHFTDLLATCIAQQEDIHSLDDAVQMHNQVVDQVNSRLQQLEQRPVAALDASSSNTFDRLNALEIDVGTLKDDAQLQQTATQELEQRICAATTKPSSAPRDSKVLWSGDLLRFDEDGPDSVVPQVRAQVAATPHFTGSAATTIVIKTTQQWLADHHAEGFINLSVICLIDAKAVDCDIRWEMDSSITNILLLAKETEYIFQRDGSQGIQQY
ncbi:hypothetical protein CBR_g4207 [Chara braunii]|uniref:Uncharacterized protein n=1 Tax=Chara braunii TaxID=69332 RepID=A0A388KHG7_CHABU|nr:hypothetical protein CBR_g4207 [Chara braunii]|eukprot:GBG69514.1 hypothetical protein CBR_g4207 [Chara braunii]